VQADGALSRAKRPRRSAQELHYDASSSAPPQPQHAPPQQAPAQQVGFQALTAEMKERLADEMGVDVTDLERAAFSDNVLSQILNSKCLSYDCLAKSITTAKSRVPGLNYGKVTHFKGDSIRNILIMSDGLGMREDCRIFGRYNKSATSFDKNYAWDLPIGPLMAVAGFNPRYPAEYDVPRAYKDPQLAEGGKYYPLLIKVFPWLEKEMAAAAARERDAKGDETDITLIKFLEYLFQMRIVFLQDSAVLQDLYPNLCSFDHPVFKDPAWPAYKQSVLDRVANAATNRIQGQVAKVAECNEELGATLSGLLTEVRSLREGVETRDKLLQNLVFYFARTSAQVMQLVKGVEVNRQQHALLMSMLSSNPGMIALRDEAERLAGALPSPLRMRAPLGAASPGAGAGRAPLPNILRHAHAVLGGGAAMAATSAAAADTVLLLTAAGEAGEGDAAAAALGGLEGQPHGARATAEGQPHGAAPVLADGAGPSAATLLPLAYVKVDVGRCSTVKSLLQALLPVDADRRMPGGWKNVNPQRIQKGVFSKFSGFISRYKARALTKSMSIYQFKIGFIELRGLRPRVSGACTDSQ
jgi:hypothetical protein